MSFPVKYKKAQRRWYAERKKDSAWLERKRTYDRERARQKYAESDEGRIKGHNDYVHRRGGEGRITLKQWNERKALFGFQCVGCGHTNDLTIDHIIPITRGGKNQPSNIQPLCKSCNSKKSNKLNYAFSR